MMKWMLALLPLLLLGCSKEVKKVEESKPIVGKYGYINGEGYNDIAVHLDRQCEELPSIAARVPSNELRETISDIESKNCNINIYYCPKCVSDEAYEYLISLDTIQ